MTTLTVTSLSDSGTGSLRDALAQASNGDTIAFDPSLSGDTIDLTSTLVIAKNVTIEGHTGGGAGAPDITLSGQDQVTILDIQNATVALDGLNIGHGHGTGTSGSAGAAGGNAAGGIYSVDAALSITNTAFSDDAARGGNGGYGFGNYGGGGGGGAGGAAAGGIYAKGGSVGIDPATVSFTHDKAYGGNGGHGGWGGYYGYGGPGGTGGYASTDASSRAPTSGGSGEQGWYFGVGVGGSGGAGGASGSFGTAAQNGQPGGSGTGSRYNGGGGGGGGGGAAFAAMNVTSSSTPTPPPCFRAGTLIRTLDGAVAVERLRAGDAVLTAAGTAVPVRWIGHRRVDCRAHPDPQRVWPVRVQAGAFGEGLPVRDLFLSPDHAVAVQGRLIPIRLLVNGATVAPTPVPAVTYYHVELPAHDVILAEDLPVESYLDVGNRGTFDNAGTVVHLHPDFTPHSLDETCLPMLIGNGPVLAELRAALRARAQALGYEADRAPHLHLVVDGALVVPERQGNTYTAAIPARARTVRLVSRCGIPANHDPASPDRRRLGVCLNAVRIAAAAQEQAIPLDHPALSKGWHAPEGNGATGWRWTNGDAHLPPALWDGLTGTVRLRLTVVNMPRYWCRTADAA